MGEPYWVDANGQRVPKRKCSRPTCDRAYPIHRYRYQHLQMIGWQLYRAASFTSWCGHGQEFIPVPDDGEWVRLVPIIGEAS